MYNENVIKTIKEKKSELKLTNLELSKKSGVPLGTLNKLLSQNAPSVKFETVQKLLKALGESVESENENKIIDNFGYVKVAVSTPNLKVSDVDYNVQEISFELEKAKKQGVKLIVFPELCITGYTCGDLFYQETLLNSAKNGLRKIVEYSIGLNMLIFVGMPIRKSGSIYNVSVAVCKGEILGFVPKTYIPNYNEFYEKRQFKGAEELNGTIQFDNKTYPFGKNLIFRNKEYENFTVATEICEDLWVSVPPSSYHAQSGAFIIANLSCSDEVVGKAEYRRTLISAHSGSNSIAYLYSNAGIGESTTDLVYSGHSLICENGKILNESKLFENSLTVADIDVDFLAFERSKIANYNYKLNPDYEEIEFSLETTPLKLNREYSKTPFVPSSGKEVENRAELILNMQTYALSKRVKHTFAKSLVIGVSGGLDSTLALLVLARVTDVLKMPRKSIIAVTMPCFGTTKRTKSNAIILSESLGVTLKEVNITDAVNIHFRDIEQNPSVTDVTYENSQARERTQVLMDIANKTGGMVIGTGDLSELALGWATYNGDHMSMYAVNCSVPKTLIRYLVKYEADRLDKNIRDCLYDVLDTPVSPELIPHKNGEIQQKTEDIVGPYILHDFYLFYAIRMGFKPSKIYYIAKKTFEGEYSEETLYKWLKNFYNRFFNQQFKRSCIPDGVKIGSVSLSPRGDWRMPSDAQKTVWLNDLENCK